MPIIIPESYYNYRVIGIDPGLNNTGVSIFHIDYFTRTITSIDSFTIRTEKTINLTDLDEEYHPERIIKLFKLKQFIQNIIIHTKPNAVSCEAPFYNRFRPMAYGALLEIVNTLHAAVLEVDSNIMFRTVEPLLAKKTIGVTNIKEKSDVRESLSRIPAITNALLPHMDDLDEHSLDSIAIGYTLINLLGVL